MRATLLPADQQFFADLLSGLVLNPQQLGRVWFAHRGASDAVGSVSRDWPRLDVVLRGEYGNRLVAGQQPLHQGEMLFLPAQAASVPVFERPVMLLSILSRRRGWGWCFMIPGTGDPCLRSDTWSFLTLNEVSVPRC